ncbi:hypothetical protein AB0M39_20635 [Streptomyces sp. NPDC051907]|uniref:hypothetical protein n=1 Tax=Streptomyces sp. NPDC051907 TaxID=3155284 RepID=UPI003413D505
MFETRALVGLRTSEYACLDEKHHICLDPAGAALPAGPPPRTRLPVPVKPLGERKPTNPPNRRARAHPIPARAVPVVPSGPASGEVAYRGSNGRDKVDTRP